MLQNILSVLHHDVLIAGVINKLVSALLLIAYHVLLANHIHRGTCLVGHVVQVDLIDIRLVVGPSILLTGRPSISWVGSDVVLTPTSVTGVPHLVQHTCRLVLTAVGAVLGSTPCCTVSPWTMWLCDGEVAGWELLTLSNNLVARDKPVHSLSSC